jgi:uncharacterized peroxidase-related enzyme
VVRAVQKDYRTAPIPETLRTVLALLEKLTLRPAEVGPDDIAPLRAAGLDDEQIEDAIQVCANFNLITRVADSLGFEASSAKGYRNVARRLMALGYK